MLTRLKVTGFKNLVGVDVRFGPFTCIAGANGVGKSNLFDAITFLSVAADRQLVDAARSVRDETGRASDIRSLFHHFGDYYAPEMRFETEMIVPRHGIDDLGQNAKASITFLKYSLALGYRDGESNVFGSLEILHEELVHINLGEAIDSLRFQHAVSWRKSAVTGRRTSPFISTEGEGAGRVIKLHQDGRQGRPLSRSAENLPRTVISATNAAESPTALVARNEMRSWRLLHLEPLSLRRSDDLSAPNKLGMDGAHLASSLYHLANAGGRDGKEGSHDATASWVYAQVANRLSLLIDDVRGLGVDRDEKRELLTLWVAGRDGTRHAARALSDGTLRFLALATLEQDSESVGLLCLEEPENGIHPARIPAMLRLLRDIATDPDEEVGAENPLRQVIVNTHSPSVVLQAPEDSLVVAQPAEQVRGYARYKAVAFNGLAGTWRQRKADGQGISLGDLLAYLNPTAVQDEPHGLNGNALAVNTRRVIDRQDIIQLQLIPHSMHA